jgi:hypothetical protein
MKTFVKCMFVGSVALGMALVASPREAAAQVVVAPAVTPVVTYYRPNPILRPFYRVPAVSYVPTVGVAPVTTYYAPAAPVTTYYAPAAPVTTYYAPAAPVTTYSAPVQTFYAPSATVVSPAPVTTYYAPTVVAPPVIIRRW